MSHRRICRSGVALVLFAVIFCDARPAVALEPDQIALIVNSNVPAGRKLADFYAEQRHIPAGRIIELPLAPLNGGLPAEDISASDYDAKVVPAVREFLSKNGLDHHVKCLLTFWGVPLRIDRRVLTASDKKELADLKVELDALKPKLEEQVKSAETLATGLDAEFKPTAAADYDSLGRRAELALNSVLRSLQKTTDAKKRVEIYEQMMKLVRDLAGQPAVIDKISQPEFWPLAPKQPGTQEIIDARQHIADLQKQMADLQNGPQNADSRSKVREIARAELGALNLARVLFTQIRSADTAESESAFDNELALLWWPAYPKGRWELNPLYWRLAGRVALPSHTLMVMRLDGPTEQSVHDLITTSIQIEEKGLTGEVVMDARGKPPSEPYGQYDQTIRNLAELLKTKTTLKLVLDNKESLIPADSEKDIALYCGWYSLRHFVSPGKFVPGAVGFHVASSEMVSLHNPKETGWSKNLMDAGVVSTLGPVAEPYLQSFPPADEFFPLLLTGKMQLAEVYWKTTPWTSWMQCCIGDPLYNPFKSNSPLKVEDLPAQLQSSVNVK